MGDIDLLIRTEDATAIARVLECMRLCGRLSPPTDIGCFRHERRQAAAGGRLGEHVDSPIKIEVHDRIAEHLPVSGDGHHAVSVSSRRRMPGSMPILPRHVS